MSIMVATGQGARHGVLWKDAAAIERFRQVDTLVVDKTGTLTEGKPAVTHVTAYQGTDGDVLSFAAAIETGSEHPLASAILAEAKERNLTFGKAIGFDAVRGEGVTGTVDGHAVALGNRALMERQRVVLGDASDDADQLRATGATAVFLAVDGQLAGLLAVADPVKATTPDAIRALHADGLRIVMLTGDHETTARAVADQLGIDDVLAGVLPDGKADAIQQLQREGAVVAMAGDGINDAPALARADVGIAMGTGTDVAIESAGVTLVHGDLRGIVRARKLSRATVRNIRQNLFWAFGYNTVGIPIAAGVLWPVFGWLLSPMIAAAAMSFSSVSVIGNALRLGRVKLDA